MKDDLKSTVMFYSNIQPVNEKRILSDHQFLSKIRDPFALSELGKRIDKKDTQYQFSEIQKSEYNYASLHCSYAFRDDYPWGTLVSDGQERIACKCLNVQCRHFLKCRPDFDRNELLICKENAVLKQQKEFNSKLSGLLDNVKTDVKPEEQEKRTFIKANPELIAEVAKKSLEDYALSEQVLVEEECTVRLKKMESEDRRSCFFDVCDFSSFVAVGQGDFIRADTKQRTIINAGPGTGKTWALIEKLIYMVEEIGIDPISIMVLCFSKAAVKVVEERLKKAAELGRIGYEWRQIEVRTFDSFATYMIAWVVAERPELLRSDYCLSYQNYDDRIHTAKKILQTATDMLDCYQHIIIDEVQDLVGIRAEMVLQLLRILPEGSGFSVLGDACQAIYDYQAENDQAVMSSDEFYNQIFHEHKESQFWKFTECHRQKNDYIRMIEPFREALLINDPVSLVKSIESISKGFPEVKIKFSDPVPDILLTLADHGTLGILTRTNGQALQISTWLRNNEITHHLQSSTNQSSFYADWIAEIFMEYPYETINQDYFSETMEKVFPGTKPEKALEYWKALANTQRKTMSRYRTAEILRGITEGGRSHLLFNSFNNGSNITVSTVHRAKGLEFDSVILLDDLFKQNQQNQNGENLIEHKTCYVGITRPREKLYRLKTPKSYISINKNEHRRCFAATPRRYRNCFLECIEFGKQGDLDHDYFAASEKLQTIIKKDICEGMPLVLKKDNSLPGYYRIMADDELSETVFGHSGVNFKLELEMIQRRNYHLPEYCEIFEYLYPDEFTDIYVNNKITCISDNLKNRDGAKVFEDICVWRGFSVTGFAHRVPDRH